MKSICLAPCSNRFRSTAERWVCSKLSLRQQSRLKSGFGKRHRGCTDFSNLEVNSVVSFSGSIVVEAQDENIDGKIAEGGVANLAIDGDGLHVTNRPIVGPLSGATHLANGGPIIIRKGAGGKRNSYGTGFTCRCRVIGVSGHADGHCDASLGLAGNSYHIPGNAHRSHARGIRNGADCTIPGPCYCDGVRHFGNIQGNGRFVQRKASSGLSNRPSNGFGVGGSIIPFVVCAGGKSGVVASGIGAAGSSPKGHFPGIIVGPSGALGGSGIGKASTLRRNRHRSPSNRPCDFPCRLASVTPLVFIFRGEGCRIGSRIGAGSHTAKGQSIGIIAVPRRALGRSVIGQGSILCGNYIDSECNAIHSFQGRISGILGVLRRFHTGVNLPQQKRVGGLIFIMGFNFAFGGSLLLIVHFRKLFSRNLPIHQIGFVFLPVLKVFDTISIFFQGGINFVHVAVLNFNIIKFRSKGFGQFVIFGLICHQFITSFLIWSWVYAASWAWVNRPSSAWVL
nr:MAG TPA: hypothetical protein [Caudoviricetes sp.]